MSDESAFPHDKPIVSGPYAGLKSIVVPGLTKRELFAAMAMQAIRASGDEFGTTEPRYEVIARMAVKYADALIAALEEK